MTQSIFSKYGGYSSVTLPGGDDYVYMVLSGGSGTAAGTLRSCVSGRAPATKVTIAEGVDYTVSKALSGDFLISQFGNKLVEISITGLDIFAAACDGGAASSRTVHEWYNLCNLAKRNARIDISLAQNGRQGSYYRCAVVSIARSIAPTAELPLSAGTYSLSLIGVKIK